MKTASKRSIRKAQKKRQSGSLWIYIGIAAVVVVAIIFAVISTSQPAAAVSTGLMGDEVPILSRDHVDNSAPPPAYNSNPPAGGAHYADPLPAKFYTDSDVAKLPKWPEGYLVHSLEHGYVIFWYNCQLSTNCDQLKKTIQDVMNQAGGTKLIAFPWTTMDVPLAMTSWGRIMKFKTPDPKVMAQFVQSNRYQAPEPNAQ
jgi:hypothetical protein